MRDHLGRSDRQRRADIAFDTARLHMQPLPDPLLASGPPSRNAVQTVMLTYAERTAVQWIAGAEGLTASRWCREVIVRAMYTEQYQRVLRERTEQLARRDHGD